jgi:hypothetical protein
MRHSEAAKAKIRAAARQRWAAGEYDFLRKPKLSAEEKAARKVERAARKAEALRLAARRQWAEGRGSLAGILGPESRRKAGATNRTSPRAIEARRWIVKFRIAKVRARRVRSSPIFNELAVVDLVLRYQRDGSAEIFARIVQESLPLLDSLIRRCSPRSPADFDEVRSDLVLKLAALIPKYDVRRGRVFSFFIFSLRNALINNFHDTVKRRTRYQLVANEELFDVLDAEGVSECGASRLASEEFLDRLRELVHPGPPDWQWRWRWSPRGRLARRAWNAAWRWQRLGTIPA